MLIKKHRKWGVLINPAANSGRIKKVLPSLIKELDSQSFDYELHFTEYPGHAVKIAGELAKHVDSIIVAGGDGTVREVANALVYKDVPLLVLPLGSGNDFHRTTFGKYKWQETLQFGMKGNVEKVDVGIARYEGGETVFVNGIGMGFDGLVVENLDKFRYLRGDLLYLIAVLYTFPKFTPPNIQAYSGDDLMYKGDVLLFSVGNGNYLGGGFYLFPEASTEDSLLDVAVVDKLSLLKFLQKLPKAYRGTHLNEPEVHYFQVPELRVHSPYTLPVHADGDHIGRLRYLEISIKPRSLLIYTRD